MVLYGKICDTLLLSSFPLFLSLLFLSSTLSHSSLPPYPSDSFMLWRAEVLGSGWLVVWWFGDLFFFKLWKKNKTKLPLLLIDLMKLKDGRCAEDICSLSEFAIFFFFLFFYLCFFSPSFIIVYDVDPDMPILTNMKKG